MTGGETVSLSMPARYGSSIHAGDCAMAVTFRSAQIRHDIDVALYDQGDQCVVHDFVAHEVREAVDACIRQVDGIGVVEHVRGDTQSVTVAFIDRRPEQRRLERGARPPRSSTQTLIASTLLAASSRTASRISVSLVTSYAMLAYAGAPGPALGCTDTASGNLQACATETPRLLIGAHAIAEVAFLDALRHDCCDAEVQRALADPQRCFRTYSFRRHT